MPSLHKHNWRRRRAQQMLRRACPGQNFRAGRAAMCLFGCMAGMAGWMLVAAVVLWWWGRSGPAPWCRSPPNAGTMAYCTRGEMCVGAGCIFGRTWENVPRNFFSRKSCPECCCIDPVQVVGDNVTVVQVSHAECFLDHLQGGQGDHLRRARGPQHAKMRGSTADQANEHGEEDDASKNDDAKDTYVLQSDVRIRAMPPKQAQALHDLLLIFNKLAPALGAPNIHFHGRTLLGLVRHHGLVPWNHDADVCIGDSRSERALVQGLCGDAKRARGPLPTAARAMFEKVARAVDIEIGINIKSGGGTAEADGGAIADGGAFEAEPHQLAEVECFDAPGKAFGSLHWRGQTVNMLPPQYQGGICSVAGPDAIRPWPFYNDNTLRGHVDAVDRVMDMYGAHVMRDFVCTEGVTGHAHPVAPRVPLTDFSPARLDAGPQLDVLIVSNVVGPVITVVLSGLRRHIANIGTIHVVVPRNLVSACQAKLQDAMCHDENTVLDWERSWLSGRNRHGWAADSTRRAWYYQQLLKMLAFQRIPSLSSRFLLWDADNVLIRDYAPFRGNRSRFLACGDNMRGKGQYVDATQALIGQPYTRKDTVVYQMAIERSALESLITHVCHDLLSEDCARHILDSIPNTASPLLGLSEYHLYYEWFASRHPERVLIDHKKRLHRTKKKDWTEAQCVQTVSATYPSDVFMVVLEQLRPKEESKYESAPHFSEQQRPQVTTLPKNSTNILIQAGPPVTAASAGGSNIFKTRASVPECSNPKILPDTSTSKMICMDNVTPGSCVVYSFGINYQWDFDDYMYNYGCTVYSFDPSMDYKSKRADRHFFEKVGIGASTGSHTGASTLYTGKTNYQVETVASIMTRLGHSDIDVLRMDTEGAEFGVLASLPYDKIGQLSLEIHMWKHPFRDWKSILLHIPLKRLQTFQNTDRVNKKTMEEIVPGVTRVYEMTFINIYKHVW